MRESIVYSVAIVATLSVFTSANGAIFRLQPDTEFIAIDMTQISLPEASTKGVDPTPFIVWYNPFDERFLTWIMTLDSGTGVQLGERLEMYLPVGRMPVDILWSTHFSSSPVRGIDPEPFIVFRDYVLQTFPVSYSPDGTPMAGEHTFYDFPVDPDDYGHATCLSEISGSEFADGEPRLFVGTEFGFLVALVQDDFDDIVVDEIIPISEVPIVDLEPIPQYGYISLGAMTSDNTVYGLDPEMELRDSKPSTRYSVIYTLSDPRPTTLSDLEVFGVTDEPLTDPDDVVHLVLANGTTDLALTEITATQNGSEALTLRLDPMSYPVKSIASGSLLMLQANGSGVLYDPAYSEVGGSSSCQLDITDEISDSCSYQCGDVNDDARITIADANYVVSYIYRDGAPPIGEADVNVDGRVTVADANYLVSFIYRSGNSPCEPILR